MRRKRIAHGYGSECAANAIVPDCPMHRRMSWEFIAEGFKEVYWHYSLFSRLDGDVLDFQGAVSSECVVESLVLIRRIPSP